MRQLVEAWTATSNGRADVAAVEGDGAGAVRALGVARARWTPLTARTPSRGWPGPAPAAAPMAVDEGAAAGRFGALWVLGALADQLDDWPVPLVELGEVASELRWWWWDAHEPATGWQLQLAVDDPSRRRGLGDQRPRRVS